ncbi:MAG: LysR family transcriptional regulator, partial [Nitrospinae bacterium]|nr:LysR family transcriptional regulator [Nitrospinota bacterium]
MTWLNYHHLYYFWVTAREGSISSASTMLRVGQPTISTSIKNLEESLNQ